MHYSDPINYHSKATSTSTSQLGKGIEGRKTSKRSKTHYIPLYPQPINEPTVFPASYKDGRDGNTTFYLFDMQTPTPERRQARMCFLPTTSRRNIEWESRAQQRRLFIISRWKKRKEKASFPAFGDKSSVESAAFPGPEKRLQMRPCCHLHSRRHHQSGEIIHSARS